jgi:hypothetical protein
MNPENPPFTPLDPNNLPWKHHMVKVLLRDGTITTGHFSPDVATRVFWEYRGIKLVNGFRHRKYWRHVALPIGWQPFPATKE